MEPDADGAMLDEQIEALRARLQVTPPGLEAAYLQADLALQLGRRFECRLAAGDLDGAAEDLDEAVEGFRAAWAGLAAAAAAGQPDAEAMAEVEELLGLALHDRFTLAAARLDEKDAVAVAAARADRDDALALMAARLRSLPDEDPDRHELALMAGRLTYERYTDPWPDAGPPDPGDLDAACDLMQQGVPGDEADEPTVFDLVCALRDRLGLAHDLADRDAFITWGERLLGFPDAVDDGRSDLHEELGLELLGRAEDAEDAEDTGDAARAARTADLDAAIRHLDVALAATAAGEPGRVALLAVLTHACWLRLDGDDSPDADVDRMTSYARRAWAAASGEGVRSGGELPQSELMILGSYLCTGIYTQLRRPGAPLDRGSIDLAIDVLTQIEPGTSVDAGLRRCTDAMLGHFLTGRGQIAGSAADLSAAQVYLLRAASEIEASDPEWSQIVQTIGIGLLVLAGSGLMTGHLDRAIELLEAAAGQPDEDDAERAAVLRAGLGMALIQRGGLDPVSRDVGDGITHLQAAHDLTPAGSEIRMAISWNLGSALLTRFTLRGDRQDLDAAEFYIDQLFRQVPGSRAAMSGLVADADLIATAARGMLYSAKSLDGDMAALDEAVRCLRAAVAMAPVGHPLHARLRSDLGVALLIRAGFVAMSPADVEEAIRQLQAAMDALPAGHRMRTLAAFRIACAQATSGIAARNPRLLRQGVGSLEQLLADLDPLFGDRVRVVGMLGMVSAELYRLTGDPADHDTAVTHLAEACHELDDRPGHPHHAKLLTSLARTYHAAGRAGPAREHGLAALRVRVRDVLLQTGTARALAVARTVAADALEVAGWCLGDAEPGLAVQALELGRGLVLHAATSAADLPGLLSAAGRDDLAREWQAEVRDGAAGNGDAPWDDDAGGAEYLTALLADGALAAPSDLRERAFGALVRSREAADLLAPPGPADVAAALTRTGADALVYLLPPSPGEPGQALLVAAGHVTGAPSAEGISLPQLRPGLSGAFADYATAHADVLALPPEPVNVGDEYLEWDQRRKRAVERWESALGALCEWAWPAVLRPVLDRVAGWQTGRLPRLVLVPIGPLSLVPWHAARSRPGDDAPWYYACAAAVISYAASARQLLQVSSQPARALGAEPVIVADPIAELGYAVQEAEAIRESCYPNARYLGSAPGRGSADGEGRPGEVLDVLPASGRPGASVLHIGCHANVVGSAPGRSHLLLAGHQQLRVDEILKHASGRLPGTPGGLVSLAACRTDLMADDYDEALTLATAFLAAGAVTVVGARWEIPDKESALLMFMYHHFMVRGGHPPRDALRLAQLWMIDPRRVAPAEMPAPLAEKARAPRLARPTAWAGFTHQGR
jgi:tetratricopeptide (TPR) repeat protein